MKKTKAAETTATTTTTTTNSTPTAEILRTNTLHNHPTTGTTHDASITPSQDKPADLVLAGNSAGNTSLHWACLNGHVSAAKALHAAGADVTALNEAGRDALQEAEGAGRIEVAEWLMGLKRVAEKGEEVMEVEEEKEEEEEEEEKEE